MYTPLDHADHNFELCNIIDGLTKDYKDWVITTAFYAALHYTEHKLFINPTTPTGYADFASYYNAEVKRRGRWVDRHTARQRLVRRYMTACNSAYRSLLTDSKFSRYQDYRCSAIASIALKNLEKIRLAATS